MTLFIVNVEKIYCDFFSYLSCDFFFPFTVLFGFLVFVPCLLCKMLPCLWIVHSWMPIRFCLTFILTIMYNRGINSYCCFFSKQDHIIGAVLIATCSGPILSVEDIAFDPWYFAITDAVWYTYRPYIYHTDIEYLINQSAIIYSTGLYQLCWNRIGD